MKIYTDQEVAAMSNQDLYQHIMGINGALEQNGNLPYQLPEKEEYTDLITGTMILDPVIASDNHTYERKQCEELIRRKSLGHNGKKLEFARDNIFARIVINTFLQKHLKKAQAHYQKQLASVNGVDLIEKKNEPMEIDQNAPPIAMSSHGFLQSVSQRASAPPMMSSLPNTDGSYSASSSSTMTIEPVTPYIAENARQLGDFLEQAIKTYSDDEIIALMRANLSLIQQGSVSIWYRAGHAYWGGGKQDYNLFEYVVVNKRERVARFLLDNVTIPFHDFEQVLWQVETDMDLSWEFADMIIDRVAPNAIEKENYRLVRLENYMRIRSADYNLFFNKLSQLVNSESAKILYQGLIDFKNELSIPHDITTYVFLFCIFKGSYVENFANDAIKVCQLLPEFLEKYGDALKKHTEDSLKNRERSAYYNPDMAHITEPKIKNCKRFLEAHFPESKSIRPAKNEVGFRSKREVSPPHFAPKKIEPLRQTFFSSQCVTPVKSKGEILHDSVKSGNLAAVKEIVKTRESVNKIFCLSTLTPFQMAIDAKHKDMILYFIGLGANITVRNQISSQVFETLLHRAVDKKCSLDIIKLLVTPDTINLSKGINPTTALWLAMYHKEIDIVCYLLESGADIGRVSENQLQNFFRDVANECNRSSISDTINQQVSFILEKTLQRDLSPDTLKRLIETFENDYDKPENFITLIDKYHPTNSNCVIS